jgi:uncharacterized heparinase superfamily protein
MSAREMLHRVWEAEKKLRDRNNLKLIPPAIDYGTLPYIPDLREKLAGLEIPSTLLAQWQEQLERARTGRFLLLNREWPDCPRERKWHLDPATSTFWPEGSYCFDINYRHSKDMGDVKYVWELNRLQYLQPIAALACKLGDSGIAKFALSELEDWIDQNPPHQSVAWASGIELALRAVSILIVTTLAGEHATSAQRAKIWGTLHAHVLWLERYPSRFSSANNHRVAEGLGLFLIGALCPQFEGAKRFSTRGWNILCESARTQILSDGTGAEQAIGYGAFVAEMLMLGLFIARACGVEAPPDYTERLALTGQWLRWFTDSGGNLPAIGDDDEARVLGAWVKNEHYARSVLGCISAMLGRFDLAPPNAEPQLRNVLFGMPSTKTDEPAGTHTFRDGGYTVFRQERNLLAMDHGALGYLSIAAHGHADALAIWLHIGGQPVLVDAGTYLYHSGDEWRDYFRGTSAHNTLCLEGAGASIMAGNFNWSHKARVTLLSADDSHAEAEHDGYVKRFGALHRRRLDRLAGGFCVTDSITGTEARKAEIGFLLHPSLRATREGNSIRVTKNGRLLLKVTHESALAANIESGWYSEGFGDKQSTLCIVFAGMLAPSQKAVTQFTYV